MTIVTATITNEGPCRSPTPNDHHMTETNSSPVPRQFLGLLLLTLWAGAIVDMAWDVPRAAVVTGLAAYVLLALMRSSRQARWVCGALAGAIAALGWTFGVADAAFAGIERALVFAAFMPTIVLVRATAELRPEIAVARQSFRKLDAAERVGGILFGCHALGSAISIGVFALLAPIVGTEGPAESRIAIVRVVVRSLCLGAVWSPFFVSVVLASQYITTVPLWQIMGLGIPFAALGLALSFFVLGDGAGGLAALRRALSSLAPIVPAVALAAALVATISGLGGLTTLQAIVLGVPPLCLAGLLPLGTSRLGEAVSATWRNLPEIGGEIGILVLAIALGAVFEAVLAGSGIAEEIAGLGLQPAAVIAFIVAGMSVAGLIGIHPIVSATAVLVVATGLEIELADILLMQAVLIGWALGAMISFSGVSVVTASALFDVSPWRLIFGRNISFVIVFGSVSVLILGFLNWAFVG